MPVGDEKIALVLILQVDPAFERTVEVAEMQWSRRPHSGQHSTGLRIGTHLRRVYRTNCAAYGASAGPLREKNTCVALADAGNFRRIHREVDDRRRLDTAIA